jgi:hypothetical protein
LGVIKNGAVPRRCQNPLRISLRGIGFIQAYIRSNNGNLRVVVVTSAGVEIDARDFDFAPSKSPLGISKPLGLFVENSIRMLNILDATTRVATGELGTINFSRCTVAHPLVVMLQHGWLHIYRERKRKQPSIAVLLHVEAFQSGRRSSGAIDKYSIPADRLPNATVGFCAFVRGPMGYPDPNAPAPRRPIVPLSLRRPPRLGEARI